ncbi:unnamed protein product [Echinostoma caproni]|uniref:UCH domain-containing protein n=1 Tax=Echinostoma caproni TaxID=27848 RepID=A0A183AVJ5_9TREM|nr:unnamed protein product [Echinostoma caproni]
MTLSTKIRIFCIQVSSILDFLITSSLVLLINNGRQLTVRLIGALGGRTGARNDRLSTVSTVGASALNLSICSASPSMASMINQGNASEADLVARAAAALHAGTEDSDRLISSGNLDQLFTRPNESMSVAANLGGNTSAASSSAQLARGSSMVSLNSNQNSSVSGLTGSNTELPSMNNPTTTPITTSSLPSLCLGEDLSVYELLIELAEAELVQTPMFPATESKKSKNVVGGGGIQTTTGVSLSSSFSLIHPIRLLLATLPTCPAATLSRTGNQLQQSLLCSPSTLLKSTPFRTLYKLQILSASLIPVDSTPWWNISPGCLLSPPSQLYANATAAPIPISLGSGTHRTSRSSVIQRPSNFVGAAAAAGASCQPDQAIPVPITPSNDPKWFMSSDSLAFASSNMLESTSAPSSPVFRRRRNFKFFGHNPAVPPDQGQLKSRQSASFRPSLVSCADSSYNGVLIQKYLTPKFGSELLSALLDTAVASASVSEQFPHRQSGLGVHVLPKQSGLNPIYQPNKDSRAGVASLIEVIAPSGHILLYQDVEIAVQSIHLLIQCVLAYPNQLLDSFLSLDRLADKLLRLLTYSPSIRTFYQHDSNLYGLVKATVKSGIISNVILIGISASIVDLLILLHHNHDPVQMGSFSAYSSAGPSSAMQTPENLSGRSSPRVSQILLGEDSTGRTRSVQSSSKCLNWDVQPVLSGRNDSGFVGLRNGGATCYMNAVLQQLFMQPGLAEALLSIYETDELDEKNILFQTQRVSITFPVCSTLLKYNFRSSLFTPIWSLLLFVFIILPSPAMSLSVCNHR